MIKITGLDKINRELQQAQKALSELDGTIGEVSFDPHDPASIEAAMHRVDALIDEHLGAYSSNAIIGPMTHQMKEKYRQTVLDRAATARLQDHKA